MYDSLSDIRNLYQELIIDHGTHPRNFCEMTHPDCAGEGYNPLCGDQVSLFVKLTANEYETINQVTFQGKGCAISMASASLLTETVLGKTVHQAIEFSKAFQELLTLEKELESPAINEIHLGKLEALAGVKAFPARVKCATLAWHAFLSALHSLSASDNHKKTGETKQEAITHANI
jgi:nitrogen fixation NifU-like protein